MSAWEPINKVSRIRGSYSHVAATKLPPSSCNLTSCMNLGGVLALPKFMQPVKWHDEGGNFVATTCE